MKIIAELDGFETEALFDIIEREIIKNREEARLSHLAKEISDSRLDWHLGHAEFLSGIKTKLLNEHTKATQYLKRKN